MVQKQHQWNELCLILDNSNWRQLSDLLGKSVLQLNDIERRTVQASPSRLLLSEWQHGENATIDAFMDALKAIDNHSAVELIQKWLK